MVPSAWVDNLLAVLLKYLCFIALQLLKSSFRYLRLHSMSYRGKKYLSVLCWMPLLFHSFCCTIFISFFANRDSSWCTLLLLTMEKETTAHPHCKQNSFHIYRVSEQTKELWSLSASFNKGLVLIIECFSYY